MDRIEIEKYRFDHAFLRDMAEQTEKDFAQTGIVIAFNKGIMPDFNTYRQQLSEEIKRWCISDPARLPALLYRIDIPEHIMLPAAFCKDPLLTAEIILKRELIKVIIRKLCSP